MKMAKKISKKFKALEKNADVVKGDDLKWEGEEIVSESTTKIEDDKGDGRAVVLRFFEFGANVETFKIHKPTAQDLFNSHMKGIESLLWRDGLKPYLEVEPRLQFSKDKTKYRFILAAIPSYGGDLMDKTQTLSQLLTNVQT